MKKLTIKVSSLKNSSIVSVMKDVNKISCRIFIDFKNGVVAVENVNNSVINDVIELVDNYYTISSIDIDNTFEETSQTTENQNFPVVAKNHSTVLDPQSEAEDTTVKVVENNATSKKLCVEKILLDTIGFALNKLDSSKKVEKQVESFLTDIGMTTTEKMVTQAFIIACTIKKINYENVIVGLHEKFPNENEKLIKNILKKAFKNWLDKYPNLAEKCSRISLMSILKLFAKSFAKK